MSIRHHNIIIPENNPFEHCRLDRKKYADILTQIVGTYADGFVLAINNKWGTGKTTFIKMWELQLKSEGFRTLYFNAWENDFELNPLTALLAELKKLISKGNEKDFKSLLSKAVILTKNIAPAVAKAIVKRYIDHEDLNNIVENSTKAGSELLEKEIEAYGKKQKGLLDFRNDLEVLIKNNIDNKPLIFIIDELDRCRPNYAVEVLERIKHFFNVDGIVFVLSIDKEQLGYAIKGVYGSENLDVSQYLKRFIDIEYSIPEPDYIQSCSYFFDYFKFSEFFNSQRRIPHKAFRDDSHNLIHFSGFLFQEKKLSLREIEKIFSHARITLLSFQENSYVFPSVLIFLIYLQKYYIRFYQNIKDQNLSPQEFIDELENIFPKHIDDVAIKYLLSTETLLIYFFHNYISESNGENKLFHESNNTDGIQLLINTRFEKYKSTIERRLKDFDREEFWKTKLDYIINKIDLIESVIQ